MPRILATVPHPNPTQASVLKALHYAFNQRRAISEADSLALQDEYHRRRAANALRCGRHTTREVLDIAAELGIPLDARQAEHVASLLSFQNIGAASGKLAQGGAL